MKKSILRNLVVAALLLGLWFAPMSTVRAQGPSVWDGTYPTTRPTGMDDGADDLTIDIYTAEEFAWIMSVPNMFLDGVTGVHTVRLNTDINLNNKPWTPSVAAGPSQSNTFDGGGHTIRNLFVDGGTYQSSNNRYFLGLFGRVPNAAHAKIQNLTVDGAVLNGSTTVRSYAGVITGSEDWMGHYENVHVKNATITASKYVGAIAAYGTSNMTNVSAENITFNVTQIGEDKPHVGGLMGLNNAGTIENSPVSNLTITISHADGTTLTNQVGALFGTAQSGVFIGSDNPIADITYNGATFTTLVGLDNRTGKVRNTTQGTSFETITDAVNASVDGDVILVSAGTYDEENILISKGIQLLGTGDGNTVIAPSGATNNSTIKVVNPSGDVLIDGFTFNNPPRPSNGATVLTSGTAIAVNSATVTVSNNIINGADRGQYNDYGLYGQGNHAAVIWEHNTLNLVGGNPLIFEQQLGSTTVRNNTVYTGDVADGSLYYSMIYGDKTVTTPQIVENNTFSFVRAGGGWSEAITFNTSPTYQWYGTDTSGHYTNIQIRNNTIILGGIKDRGIGLADRSAGAGKGTITGAVIENNTITGQEAHVNENTVGILLRGDVQGTQIKDNIFTTLANGVQLIEQLVNNTPEHEVPSGTIIEDNAFNSSVGVALKNENTEEQVDASPNYWGSATGPDPNSIVGDVNYMPFWIDPEMTQLVNTDAPVLHYSGNVNVPGGIHIWLPNTQVYLAADTVIQNESPCFVIHADGVKIDAELGAKCIPTDGADGIYIDDGLSGIRVSGLEIDGTGQTSNHGINVDGVINNYVFVNNRIHALGGNGIHFAAQPTGIPTVVDISGNLFYANTGVGVNNPAGTEDVNAQFNAWGDPAGPTGPAGDGVGDHVDSSNFTHVDLSLASSGPVWEDQVVRGPHILNIKGRPIVLKDGDTYHMWAGESDSKLVHYESTDPSFADAGAGTETTYDDKPIEVGSVTVVKEGDVFYMIAYGSTNQLFNIYTSTDGNSWLNKGLIFNAGDKEGLSGGKVDAPSIILDGTGSKIYFQYGSGTRNIYMISTGQTLSAIANGDNVEDYTFDTTINPVLRPTETDLASTMLFHPWVVKEGTKYYMYYTAYSPNVPTFRARMATSDDGEVWTFHTPNPVMQATSAEPSVVKDGGTWRMYFLGDGGKVGYVSGQGPAEFNETITYSVKANLTNVNGAEFTLTYPENLVYIGAAGDGNFSYEEVSHNPATRTISFLAYQINTMVTETGLDILKVNFAGKTAGTDLPMDLNFDLAGGFTTYSPGHSQIVFPMGLVDGEVTVFDLPTITSTYADDYYLIGDAQDFEVTVTNTTGTFAATELRLTIPAGLTLTLNDPNYSLVGSTVNLGELAANETITLTFTATFSTISTDPLRFDLYDTAVDPDFELAAVSSIATVYTKPTIATDGLTGNHLGLDVPFTVTIGNLSDMSPVTFMLDLGFPAGTVVSYGGTDYLCGTSGCQIPVTLTVPTTELDFTATFPGAYDGDVVVTLYDSLADPDRPLATETVTSVVVVPNAGTITGTITMQGRTSHAGAIMILTPPTGAPYGPYQATSTDAIGINIQFTNVAGATYTITTNTPRYLNVPATLAKTIDVMVKQSIAPLRLIGGNAVYTDNVINISDSGLIGTQYGNTGPTWDGDVNFDGVVNIRDLALVGGNYLLTSEGTSSVYNSWLP